jgi:glucose/arabinose dehydrogenase
VADYLRIKNYKPSFMRNALIFKALIFLVVFAGVKSSSFSQSLAITEYTAGLISPIDIKNCGDNRLFVAERAGRIRIINADSSLRPAPFLDITSKVPSTEGEQGLLGFAFSPNYKTDGKFYVNYVGSLNAVVTSIIEEYKVNAADSNVADISSSLTILTQQQPVGLTNHKGGNMMFGKDGYLYISLGDGGGAGDPFNNGQNTNTFLGKILRIDVSNSSLAQPYVIPPTNPFYNDATAGIKKEIWAYGVRNPWRCSVDRITGDVWIADVGQGNLEEIDLQPFGSPLTPNFGWKIMEGTACYEPATGCANAGLKLPIYEYNHSIGQSITGGYVYRSAHSKALFGMYIYTDYVQKWIDGFRQNNGTATLPVTRLLNSAAVQGNPISFGEDMYGDLYILFNGDNTVYKISDTSNLRRPKAYFTPLLQTGGGYILQGLQGNNLSYQWLKDGVSISGATTPGYVPQEPGTYNLVVTNSTSVSDTSDAFIFGALAVELKGFTARRINNKPVELKWKTTFDNNVLGYFIQKRTGSQTTFSNIGFVPARQIGTATQGDADYMYIDSFANNNAQLFYRLEIKNKDGSLTYSNIKSINSRNIDVQFIVYPNPAKNTVNVYLDNFSGPIKLVLHDNMGKKVKQQQLTQQLSTVSLYGLKGIYTISLLNNIPETIARAKLLVE